MPRFFMTGLLALLYLAVAAILIRKYRRTRDAGFIWPGIAIFIWPPLASLIHSGEPALLNLFSRGHLSWLIPVTWLDYRRVDAFRLVTYLDGANQLIYPGLFLAAISCLYNARANQRPAS
ncbi:MAG TPA: hypothetical protein VG273_06115 [Bryobacteraceae bacterium]|jgi:hypothetical protein|nr:hypothetical protein [Bryobacteraceae bacterium]